MGQCGYFSIGGAMWASVGQCGLVWACVGQCGPVWTSVGQCGQFSSSGTLEWVKESMLS